MKDLETIKNNMKEKSVVEVRNNKKAYHLKQEKEKEREREECRQKVMKLIKDSGGITKFMEKVEWKERVKYATNTKWGISENSFNRRKYFLSLSQDKQKLCIIDSMMEYIIERNILKKNESGYSEKINEIKAIVTAKIEKSFTSIKIGEL